jgi:signal transduction histidine kinase
VETANGDLWVNGLGGIFHIRRSGITEALKNPVYQVSGERFGRGEGLPGLAAPVRPLPSAIEGTDGRLWFTVNNGLVWVDPAHASKKVPPPPVTIQSVSADDKGYRLELPIRLPPRTSSVQISYAAVSLSDAGAIRFRYKLRETDKDWRETGNTNSVSYRSLAPGSYHFVVNATDANGVWAENNATAEFTVLPAFYQTNWFRAAFAAVVLALLWGLYRLRLYQIEREFNAQLDGRVDERLRVARELHDTLLQSFQASLIQMQVVRNILHRSPEKAEQSLDKAITTAAGAVAEGRSAIQNLRLDPASRGDLAELLTAAGQELAHSEAAPENPPVFRVTVEGEQQDLKPLLQDEVYRIARELLRNACRHAQAGRIEAEVRYESRQFRVHVRDDGKGIDPEIMKTGGRAGHWGLPGMQERASRAGGKLEFWSEAGAGTEAVLTMPAAVAYAASNGGRFSFLRRKKAAI